MCGICGCIRFDGRLVPCEVLDGMNHQIAHRGPDDAGTYSQGSVGLAMRRLSIIDVASGRQPISNEDGNIWIVYNGEIYNHAELRPGLEQRGHRYRTHSDTETIIHLYEEYGRDCVQQLHGMFAFAIWDARSRKLFAARDRLGIKPFYYLHDNEKFIFASEIKALLAYPGVHATFNREVLSEYLAFGYLSGRETFFEGIHKLPPGHTIALDESGKLEIRQYWELKGPTSGPPHPQKYYLDNYREMLEQAVSSHLMSDVPLGVFLSGGLDSSAVAALATKARGPLQTFSVGYGEQKYSELPYAKVVADYLGSEHHEVILTRQGFFDALPKLIWHEDEPVSWPSSVSLYFVAHLARERVKVVLTGEGSDETLAGYTRYPWTLWNRRADSVYRSLTPASLRAAVRSGMAKSHVGAVLRRRLEHTFLARDGASWESFYFDNFYSAFSAEEQAGLLRPAVHESVGNPYAGPMHFWQHSSGDLLQRLLYTDIKTYLVELLMKQDSMSMAASIESRVPFLDHKLVEFAFSIPAQHSTRAMAGKCILKTIAEDLLPHEIVHRRKLGFPTPWSGWLAERQLDELEQSVAGSRSMERGLFQPSAVKKLFADHRAGVRDNANRIWRLLNLELWLRIFIDRDPAVLGLADAAAVQESAILPR